MRHNLNSADKAQILDSHTQPPSSLSPLGPSIDIVVALATLMVCHLPRYRNGFALIALAVQYAARVDMRSICDDAFSFLLLVSIRR